MRQGTLETLGNLNSIKVGCTGGIDRQESIYLRALGDGASYRVQYGRLEVQDAVGETTLVYETRE